MDVTDHTDYPRLLIQITCGNCPDRPVRCTWEVPTVTQSFTGALLDEQQSPGLRIYNVGGPLYPDPAPKRGLGPGSYSLMASTRPGDIAHAKYELTCEGCDLDVKLRALYAFPEHVGRACYRQNLNRTLSFTASRVAEVMRQMQLLE